jgi:hypothetical protein
MALHQLARPGGAPGGTAGRIVHQINQLHQAHQVHRAFARETAPARQAELLQQNIGQNRRAEADTSRRTAWP